MTSLFRFYRQSLETEPQDCIEYLNTGFSSQCVGCCIVTYESDRLHAALTSCAAKSFVV